MCGTRYTGCRGLDRVLLRAPNQPASRPFGASNLDAHLMARCDWARGAHAVEFSKTVAPNREGDSFFERRTPGTCPGERTGQDSTVLGAPQWRRLGSAGRPGRSILAGSRGGTPARQLTTWTETTRSRGRSSKSSRTTCCQVPRPRPPSTIGIDSEGPMIAALRCAWAFVSWLSSLWR